MLSFAVTAANGAVERLPVIVHHLIIAGWTGRDQAKVQEHINELKELGVAPPTSTPVFYPLSAALVTQSDAIEVLGDGSSGEVEAMLIGTARGMLVTLASDHTDRKAEAYSIQISKQMCSKPVARTAWWFADVADHWDKLTLQSWQDGAVYQDGDCTARHPAGARRYPRRRGILDAPRRSGDWASHRAWLPGGATGDEPVRKRRGLAETIVPSHPE